MAARHCSNCNTDWPLNVAYEPCPECGGKTWTLQGAAPISLTEAETRRKTAAFNAFYEDWTTTHSPSAIAPPTFSDKELGDA